MKSKKASEPKLRQYIIDDPVEEAKAAEVHASPRFGKDNENTPNKYEEDSIGDLFAKSHSKVTSNKDNSINMLDESINISPNFNNQ